MARDLLCMKCAHEFRQPDEFQPSRRVLMGTLRSDPGFYYRLVYGKAKNMPDRFRTISINGEPQTPNPTLLCDLCNATINVGDDCACRSIYPRGHQIAEWEDDYLR